MASALRATRLQTALRASAPRSIHRVSRRTYASKDRSYHGGDQPPPAGSQEKVPTKPSEVNNRGTIYAIGGITVVLAGFFAFLTGAPDRAAGVADTTSRSGSTLLSGPLSGKEGGEKDLEAHTGRDPNRSTGLAGLKSDATDPNAPKARN
ncbi:hypothetical protein Cob_v008124 [Colletotrichum orbiculare MAFF 240422]|uniref:Uncharacterized protein n=1 Tax=Colletotrichum orbiculare (strain 104-T / ATCC 96160 / CBS 514.97 / LARS 414 / MAFF 240422) TaxID=1213857 RepID=A0A484FLY9_COLOR|nr:hypothetical protein Cob_v008124 [Colletotrichum orbiculare MAFF 240422]